MLVIMFVVLLSLVLVVGLYLGEFVLSVKDYNVFKVFSFESGFKSVGMVHCAFSIHFFIMMLMFVVFDLEVVMLVGLVVVDKVYYVVFYMLFFFVVGGFLMEWYFGKLVWLI
uniref:NADH-ubiquinone oxidoreductase chain 3 n=1 Tax=Enterobius vermicularis TaxID=51028 RepID=A0A1E1GIK7_ENTVE|nr:NADH dehydrogenase subunit 3 [Enterobius vermicularis]BAV82699.1 NADH dehydrogenase subunit 3 [Enterobius vermicularis]